MASAALRLSQKIHPIQINQQKGMRESVQPAGKGVDAPGANTACVLQLPPFLPPSLLPKEHLPATSPDFFFFDGNPLICLKY